MSHDGVLVVGWEGVIAGEADLRHGRFVDTVLSLGRSSCNSEHSILNSATFLYPLLYICWSVRRSVGLSVGWLVGMLVIQTTDGKKLKALCDENVYNLSPSP